MQLWEEKLQLRAPFKGNAATQWGTVQEDVALQCYIEVCSPQLVSTLLAAPSEAPACIQQRTIIQGSLFFSVFTLGVVSQLVHLKADILCSRRSILKMCQT